VKTTLICFSGTGNSLAVARLLAAKLTEARVVSAREALTDVKCAVGSDALGFVFPVYCQNAPEMVRRAVMSVEVPPGAYLFAVATHNGDPGYSHYSLDRILRKRGSHLSAGFAVLMPGNSITPGDSTNPLPEQQRRLREAPVHVGAIARPVLKREEVPFAGSDSLRKRLRGLRNMFRHKVVHKVPERFWVTEACSGCGLCAQVCPEDNIRLDGASPTWGGRCQMCLACIHWCPQRAVQNGEGTLQRRRYHHPDISSDDMVKSGAPR
jgi:Pyruvate/2-oxoacid:ferredoxin oxidoreductase delta subunit